MNLYIYCLCIKNFYKLSIINKYLLQNEKMKNITITTIYKN